MTVQIQLTKGYATTIDDVDADLAELKWCAGVDSPSRIYAMRTVYKPGGRHAEILHRVILARELGRALAKGECVDHINGDTLNNRRSNLRVASNAQNTANQRRTVRGASGLKGVYKHSDSGWQAHIGVNGKIHCLGTFPTPELAHAAYVAAALELHGEFAQPEYHEDATP